MDVDWGCLRRLISPRTSKEKKGLLRTRVQSVFIIYYYLFCVGSNIIYGLLAGWIRELQKIKSKQPDVCFRELLALTTSAFNDEHWICDTDGPDIVCFLVNEMGILWNFILKKSNEVLKISDPIRKDLKNLFKLYKKKLKSLSEDYETPIEFALTSIRLKNTKENYCLDEIIEMGADIKRCIASYKV